MLLLGCIFIDEAFHSGAVHSGRSCGCAVAKHRAGLENLSWSQCRNDCVVILHRATKFVFVHRISPNDSESLVSLADAFGRTNKRGDIMTSGESLLNNLAPRSTGRSYDK